MLDHQRERERRFPDYYGGSAHLNRAELTTIGEVLSNPEKAHWLDAMEKEMTTLQENDVWELVELPKGRSQSAASCRNLVYKLL